MQLYQTTEVELGCFLAFVLNLRKGSKVIRGASKRRCRPSAQRRRFRGRHRCTTIRVSRVHGLDKAMTQAQLALFLTGRVIVSGKK